MTPWLDSNNPPQPSPEARIDAALREYRQEIKKEVFSKAADYLETIATWIEAPPRQYRERAWKMLIRQHPEYLAAPPRFTPKGLRQFFDWVWDRAECKPVDSGYTMADLEFLKTLMGMGEKK